MTDAPKSVVLTPALHEYVMTHSMTPDAIQRSLIEDTSALGDISIMQIAPEQGTFMTLLTRILGATHALEVGTFTGYSALAIARGLPDDGQLLCCDVSEEWTAIAREHWIQAGVADRIDLRIAPALETLQSLADVPVFDIAFLDADKPGYIAYHEEIVPRLRPGGVLLVDNVLFSGLVVDESIDEANVVAIRAYNDHVVEDDRVEQVVLPIADGLTLARKR